MSIKVEFEFQTVDDVVAFFARVAPLYSVPVASEPVDYIDPPTQSPDPVAVKPKKVKKAKAKAEPAEAPSVGEPLTQPDVRAALAAFLASKGIDGCTAVLKKYGVARISELAPEQYGSFVEECKS